MATALQEKENLAFNRPSPVTAPVSKKTGSVTAAGEQNYSELELERMEYKPVLPNVLKGDFTIEHGAQTTSEADEEKIQAAFPSLYGRPKVHFKRVDGEKLNGHTGKLNVGIVLSGGQAAGGHNVIGGLFDYLSERKPGSRLFGFLNGPRGVFTSQYKEITAELMKPFRNQGGFHMICSGRDKIETPEQLEAAAKSCKELDLDGLVVCGGDDSNTNAAVLAEYFISKGLKTKVIGVPKTIDGDLKNRDVAISFGFDTACKVYSEMIGNIMIDASSAKKYYHFVRLMGRSASHITLECALQTHPQAALISEEIEEHDWSLHKITCLLADLIASRSARGLNYGVVLIPEGLIEFVPEVKTLIAELNELMAKSPDAEDVSPESVAPLLSERSQAVFKMLPHSIRSELLLERDPHGNVQVARIETEKLLIKLVEKELHDRKANGTFKGKFAALNHYFGYEGRCSLPTNFDATYCNVLGYAAAALIERGETGLMATVDNLRGPASEWGVGGTPLTSMMNVERRKGKDKPVIKKGVVDLHGPAFKAYAAVRERWSQEDAYQSPGPIQFHGRVANLVNHTLSLEVNDGRMIRIA